MCDQAQREHHDSLPSIFERADHFEQAVVRAFRCIATAMTTGEAAWYDVAHRHCIGAVGERCGGRLVGEVMTLTLAIQRDRRTAFNVMSPDCGRLTQDEECQVAAVRQAGNVPGGVAMAAVHLSGANHPESDGMLTMALDVLGRPAKELRFAEGYGHAGWSEALLH